MGSELKSGKIQLVKTFAIPKFIYRTSFISFDKEIIKSINSVIFNFVWKGKDKMKRLAHWPDHPSRRSITVVRLSRRTTVIVRLDG